MAVTYVPNELLSRLVVNRLVEVSFVLNDYLTLRFDNAIMHIWVWPQVQVGDRVWRESDPGYADALRAISGGTVIETSERSGDGLRITLDTGEIHVNPSIDEVHVEIALLDVQSDFHFGTPGGWMCWRPGGESFEHLC